MNIYVGNISPKLSSHQLREMFEMYGKVDKVSINDKMRNIDAYGFCFVHMPFENQASRAIRELDGKLMYGYALSIKESGISV